MKVQVTLEEGGYIYELDLSLPMTLKQLEGSGPFAAIRLEGSPIIHDRALKRLTGSDIRFDGETWDAYKTQ